MNRLLFTQTQTGRIYLTRWRDTYRNHKSKSLLLVIVSFLVLIAGCRAGAGTPNITRPPVPATENHSLYWNEIQGRFSTNDLTRAQDQVPFRLILPTYIPGKVADMQIAGPIRSLATNSMVEVMIRYLLRTRSQRIAQLILTETNDGLSLGDPNLNSDLETTEIKGLSVVKTKDTFSKRAAYFSFNHASVYYVLELNDLPVEEGMRIVESIIGQLR